LGRTGSATPTTGLSLEGDIARHLSHLDALRDIRRIFTGLGDLNAELTVLARYALTEMDHEADLLRIVLAWARSHPELVATAIDTLIAATYTSFAGWLIERTTLDQHAAEVLAAVGLGALFSSRLMRVLLGRDPIAVDDETFVVTWVAMVLGQLPQT
jgi:hypothetical protein